MSEHSGIRQLQEIIALITRMYIPPSIQKQSICRRSQTILRFRESLLPNCIFRTQELTSSHIRANCTLIPLTPLPREIYELLKKSSQNRIGPTKKVL